MIVYYETNLLVERTCSETVFSIVQMIVDGTETTFRVPATTISVPETIIGVADTIVSIKKMMFLAGETIVSVNKTIVFLNKTIVFVNETIILVTKKIISDHMQGVDFQVVGGIPDFSNHLRPGDGYLQAGDNHFHD